MRVLITGGLGFLGRKLAAELRARGTCRGQNLREIVLADVVTDEVEDATSVVVDISDGEEVAGLMDRPFDVIFHLAAVVSAAAERDFDLGMRVNLDGTRNLLEAARLQGSCPVVVYASSCAAHGGNEPDPVPENVELNPQTSYGTQKVIGELLLNDMSRRGFVDGRGLRLPTVTIRSGKPNAAASSFMSSIFREPLQGEPANCPVDRDYVVWHSAPRNVVHNILHAAEIDGAYLGYNRNFNLPGRADTVGQMIDAMTEIAGPDPARLITWEPDPLVQKICEGWRGRVHHETASRLGFRPDSAFADNVRWFLEDDISPGAR